MDNFNKSSEIDKIFNVSAACSEYSLPCMETLYETKHYFNPCTYLQMSISCDENKQLFILVHGEGCPCLGTLSGYRLDEGMILYFPISPAAAMDCRRAYFLCDKNMLDSEAD